MVLTTPTLLSQIAFDATQEQIFYFNIINPSVQIVANELIIRNNETNDIVYDEKQESFKYEHIVNANELINGIYYNATVSVFDNEGNQSSFSIPIQFWCYTTPILEFTNIPLSNIINNASFNFEFTYTQAENEPLNTYIINLYNSSNIVVSTSGTQYTSQFSTTNPPFNGNYLFQGLSNSTQYFIQITGTTIEGTEISSSLISFTVQYIQPDLFTTIQLTNNCDEGYITIQSNIVLIEGTSNPDPPIYINNEEVDLTNSENWVEWNQGFNINGNFLNRIWFRNPTQYSQIIQFSNSSGQQITINYMLGYENINSENLMAYVEVYVNSLLQNDLSYYIFSNYVTPLPNTEIYVLYLTQINNIYQVQLLTSTS